MDKINRENQQKDLSEVDPDHEKKTLCCQMKVQFFKILEERQNNGEVTVSMFLSAVIDRSIQVSQQNLRLAFEEL